MPAKISSRLSFRSDSFSLSNKGRLSGQSAVIRKRKQEMQHFLTSGCNRVRQIHALTSFVLILNTPFIFHEPETWIIS